MIVRDRLPALFVSVQELSLETSEWQIACIEPGVLISTRYPRAMHSSDIAPCRSGSPPDGHSASKSPTG